MLPEYRKLIVRERMMLAALLLRRKGNIRRIVRCHELAVDGELEELVAERLHHAFRRIAERASVDFHLDVAAADFSKGHRVKVRQPLVGGDIRSRDFFVLVGQRGPFLPHIVKRGPNRIHVVRMRMVLGKSGKSVLACDVVAEVFPLLPAVLRPALRDAHGKRLSAVSRELHDRAVFIGQFHESTSFSLGTRAVVNLHVLILAICVNTCYNNNCKGER